MVTTAAGKARALPQNLHPYCRLTSKSATLRMTVQRVFLASIIKECSYTNFLALLVYLCFPHCFAEYDPTFQHGSRITHGCTHPIIPFDFFYSRFHCVTPVQVWSCLAQIKKYAISLLTKTTRDESSAGMVSEVSWSAHVSRQFRSREHQGLDQQQVHTLSSVKRKHVLCAVIRSLSFLPIEWRKTSIGVRLCGYLTTGEHINSVKGFSIETPWMLTHHLVSEICFQFCLLPCFLILTNLWQLVAQRTLAALTCLTYGFGLLAVDPCYRFSSPSCPK